MKRTTLCIVTLWIAFTSSEARATTEEVTFRSGSFEVVGDLKLPPRPAPHPVIIFVHGDGPNNRTSGVTYPPIMKRMLRAGYATFAWDKPGTGHSTGRIDRSRVVEQRARIVIDAIAFLRNRSDVDSRSIGLWGISQAGYVIPTVLSQSDDIAFIIAVSCPGVPGVEQGIYLLASQMVCAGYPKADLARIRWEIRAFTMATTYEEYVEHKAPFTRMGAFTTLARYGQRVEVASEKAWHPPNHNRPYYSFDPLEIIRKTSIPVLAVFGERDTQADPIQGAQAYREALDRGANPKSRVVLIPGVDHNILISETGCIAERDRRSAAGWRNYPPEYLDLIEDWLRQLRR